MKYSDLILWIERHFPGADYNVTVGTIQKRATGKETRWEAYVWTKQRTYNVQGHNADQVKAQLEARLEAPRVQRLDLVDADKVSA